MVSLIGRIESEKALTFSDHLGPIVSASFVIVSRNDVPNPPKMFLIFSNGPLAPVANPKIDPKTRDGIAERLEDVVSCRLDCINEFTKRL